MIDQVRSLPLKVLTNGGAGPYIMVTEDQLEEVKQLLDRHDISYWVEENFISFDGSPFIGVINLGLKGDAVGVQKIFDGGAPSPEG